MMTSTTSTLTAANPLGLIKQAIVLAGKHGEDQEAFYALVEDYLLFSLLSARRESETINMNVNINVNITSLPNSNELIISGENASAFADVLFQRGKSRFPETDMTVERRTFDVAICVKRIFSIQLAL